MSGTDRRAAVAPWQSISRVMRRLWVRFPPAAPKRKTRRESCLSFWVPAAEGGLHPPGLKCSGWQSRPSAEILPAAKRSNAAKAARPDGRLEAAAPGFDIALSWGPGPLLCRPGGRLYGLTLPYFPHLDHSKLPRSTAGQRGCQDHSWGISCVVILYKNSLLFRVLFGPKYCQKILEKACILD